MGELVQLKNGQKIEDWTIVKKLGEGAFGAVYEVMKEGGKKHYALKVEAENDPIGMLKMEVYVMQELKNTKKRARHFCELADKGHAYNFNYLVMTLVGKSIQDLRACAPQHKFSMGCALSIGRLCLEAVEDLHDVGILHRDIKPGNYTVGRKDEGELRTVYMLDFGMARKFINEKGVLRNPRAKAGFRGTVKYAPLACHVQREQCRKDDIESWLYMLVELTVGRLPWRNLTEVNDVGMFKKDCKAAKYRCLFGGCPRQFTKIFPLLELGKFFDAPDYQGIYKLLDEAMKSTKSEEFPYDWEREDWDARVAEQKAQELAAKAERAKKLKGGKAGTPKEGASPAAAAAPAATSPAADTPKKDGSKKDKKESKKEKKEASKKEKKESKKESKKEKKESKKEKKEEKKEEKKDEKKEEKKDDEKKEDDKKEEKKEDDKKEEPEKKEDKKEDEKKEEDKKEDKKEEPEKEEAEKK
ncbi:unnamed protein product, partial [Mesorhabditis spiculigera]